MEFKVGDTIRIHPGIISDEEIIGTIVEIRDDGLDPLVLVEHDGNETIIPYYWYANGGNYAFEVIE